MTSLKRNTAANLLGTATVATLYLVTLPVYLRLLGADAFGIVGLFFSLSAIFAIFDFGLGSSLSRHMAKLSAVQEARVDQRVALRTYESVAWAMCAILGVVLLLVMPTLVDHWLQTGQLNKVELRVSFRWMAMALALQIVLSLYTFALAGLQQQVVLNTTNSLMIALRLLGAVAVLLLGAGDLTHFFMWQTLIVALHAFILAYVTWHVLPGNDRPIFRLALLIESKRFIMEVALATLFATLLMHIDKIVLSKVISIKDYGYYMLAWSAASVLARLAGPIYSAWVPRLTQHIANADAVQLKRVYYKGLTVAVLLVLPSVLVLALLPEPILLAYTKDAELAKASALALVMLSIGSACHGILLMPHAVAIAHGWTRLSLVQNVLACAAAMPLVYLAATNWGLNGAGVGWMLVNLILLVVTVPMIQRYCLVIPRRFVGSPK